MDLFPAFERAVTSTAEIVKAVPGSQLDAPVTQRLVAFLGRRP